MSENNAELRWREMLGRIAPLLSQQRFAEVIEELDAFLASELDPVSRSDALGMRAEAHKEMGELNRAKKDLLQAQGLVGPSYSRYVHELCLAKLCEQRSEKNEAATWYRAALNTCIHGQGNSAGNALAGFLALVGEIPNDEDRILSAEAARKSWHVLKLPGEPQIGQLPLVVSLVQEAEARHITS